MRKDSLWICFGIKRVPDLSYDKKGLNENYIADWKNKKKPCANGRSNWW